MTATLAMFPPQRTRKEVKRSEADFVAFCETVKSNNNRPAEQQLTANEKAFLRKRFEEGKRPYQVCI